MASFYPCPRQSVAKQPKIPQKQRKLRQNEQKTAEDSVFGVRQGVAYLLALPLLVHTCHPRTAIPLGWTDGGDRGGPGRGKDVTFGLSLEVLPLPIRIIWVFGLYFSWLVRVGGGELAFRPAGGRALPPCTRGAET